MAAIRQFTEEEMEERFEKLPPSLQNAMFDEDIAGKMYDLGKSIGLPADKRRAAAAETGNVVLGLVRPEELSTRLSERTGLSPEKAQSLARGIYQSVLRPLAAELQRAHGYDINERSFAAGAPATPPQLKPNPQGPTPIVITPRPAETQPPPPLPRAQEPGAAKLVVPSIQSPATPKPPVSPEQTPEKPPPYPPAQRQEETPLTKPSASPSATPKPPDMQASIPQPPTAKPPPPPRTPPAAPPPAPLPQAAERKPEGVPDRREFGVPVKNELSMPPRPVTPMQKPPSLEIPKAPAPAPRPKPAKTFTPPPSKLTGQSDERSYPSSSPPPAEQTPRPRVFVPRPQTTPQGPATDSYRENVSPEEQVLPQKRDVVHDPRNPTGPVEVNKGEPPYVNPRIPPIDLRGGTDRSPLKPKPPPDPYREELL